MNKRMDDNIKTDKWFSIYMAVSLGMAFLIPAVTALIKGFAAGMIIAFISAPVAMVAALCLFITLRHEAALPETADDVGRIIVTSGEMEGAELKLADSDSIIIGRDPQKSELIFNYPKVSRKHCKITYYEAASAYGIINYSCNGIIIGKRKIKEKGIEIFATAGTEITISEADKLIIL